MSDELFTPIKFTTNIYLKPNEIKSNFDDIFLNKLKKKLEGLCTKHGYIKKNSIKILKRSCGSLIKQHFNGSILYELQCIAEICNPVKGTVTKCVVKNKNSMGILAQGFYDNEPILEIIIPKISAGIKSEIDLNLVNIGDEINIEVCGKKYILYDKYISIIGKVIKNVENKNINEVYEEISDEEDVNNDDENILNELDDDKFKEEDEEEDDEDEEEEEEEEDDIDSNNDDDLDIEEDIDEDFDIEDLNE